MRFLLHHSLLGTAVLMKVANTRSNTKNLQQTPLVPVHFQSASAEETPFYL